jgi:hypothetical protein
MRKTPFPLKIIEIHSIPKITNDTRIEHSEVTYYYRTELTEHNLN